MTKKTYLVHVRDPKTGTWNDTGLKVYGPTPVEAYTRAYPDKSLMFCDTKPGDKADLCLELVDSSHSWFSYYKTSRKSSPRPVTAKTTAGIKLLFSLYDKKTNSVAGVVIGRTSARKTVAGCIKKARTKAASVNMNAGDLLEDLLPDDCKVLWLSSKNMIEW